MSTETTVNTFDLVGGVVVTVPDVSFNLESFLAFLQQKDCFGNVNTTPTVVNEWTGFTCETYQGKAFFVALSSDGTSVKCQCFPPAFSRDNQIDLHHCYLTFNRIVASFIINPESAFSIDKIDDNAVEQPSAKRSKSSVRTVYAFIKVAEDLDLLAHLSSLVFANHGGIGLNREPADVTETDVEVDVEVDGEVEKWLGYSIEGYASAYFVAKKAGRVCCKCEPYTNIYSNGFDWQYSDFVALVTSFFIDRESPLSMKI